MTSRRPEHRRFELRVFPRGDESYGVALYQEPVGSANGAEPLKVVQIWGDPLKAVIGQILETLKRSGYRPSELGRSRRAPFRLAEEEAVRLGLLLLAVRPLRKLARIDDISHRVGGMEPEEIYYWYSKVTGSNGSGRARRALRLLLAEE